MLAGTVRALVATNRAYTSQLGDHLDRPAARKAAFAEIGELTSADAAEQVELVVRILTAEPGDPEASMNVPLGYLLN